MARSTTIRLPGTTGPDIVIDRRALAKPRLSVDGQPLMPTAGSKDSYSVVTPEGAPRSFSLKSDRTGLIVVADDGSRLALDPPRPVWETVLALLPVGLVAVGGVIGGLFGGVAAGGNIAISRSSLTTPVRVAAMVGVTIAAVVIWLIVAVGVAVFQTPIPTYAAGQCVNGIDAAGAIDATDIRTTDCGGPHRGEVVGVHLLTTASGSTTYPGLSSVEATASERCPSLFETFVGISFDASRLEMVYLYPTDITWALGDRQIACIAIGASGDELNGTVAGTAR